MDKLAPDRLSNLPEEILAFIVQNVSGQQNLKSLCAVSKKLYHIATPFLYETVTIDCLEGLNPTFLDLEKFSKSSLQPEYRPVLKHIKDLSVRSAFCHLREYRCYHHRAIEVETRRYETGTSTDGSSDDFHNLDDEDAGLENDNEDAASENRLSYEEPDCNEEDFLFFCQQLKDNGLRSFSWNLGACVPENILGPKGYLPVHQNSVECLSLITDASCSFKVDALNEMDLSAFKNLSEFSWIGLQSREDFEALSCCLQNNAAGLNVLKLDIIDWEEAEDSWRANSCNFFATDILGLQPDTAGLHFLSLRSLSLSALSFRSAVTDLSSAFRLNQLQQLRLWKCPGVVDLLEAVAHSRQTLQLISLEIVVGLEDSSIFEEVAINRFLLMFSGLRDLYISLHDPEWSVIADSIWNHLSTLERLVLHDGDIDMDQDSQLSEDEFDGGFIQCDEISDLFKALDCVVMGIGNSHRFMRECLEPIASNMTCRMLHLRASGNELGKTSKELNVARDQLHTFAEWVFSPSGIPTLDVLAHGDFSFPDPHEAKNTLLCRCDKAGGPSFQTLEPNSGPLWDWVQSHMDALGACAYRAIINI